MKLNCRISSCLVGGGGDKIKYIAQVAGFRRGDEGTVPIDMDRSRRKDVPCEGDGLADEADRDVESNRGVREAVNRRQPALLSVERTFMRRDWRAFVNAAGLLFHVPTVMFHRGKYQARLY